MKSFRLWFSSLALGAALVFSAPSAQAQVPQGFTYQGVIEENGVPLPGTQTVMFTISFSEKNGNELFTETLANQPVTEGMFNLVIGGPSLPFPPTITFNEQYFMTVVIATSNGTITIPTMPLESSPYAINAGTVNGMQASPVPVQGDLYPVPIGTGYTGSAKMDPAFLPTSIPNTLLSTPDITQINNLPPNTTGNFTISGDNGVTITSQTNGITISGSNVVGSSSSSAVAFTVENSETVGNDALLVRGGIGANNATGAADGDGINTVQTYWADQVAVPSSTGTSLVILNTLVGAGSTILVTPIGTIPTQGAVMITSQGAGTFTVSSKNIMGTGGGGSTTALNYMVVNH